MVESRKKIERPVVLLQQSQTYKKRYKMSTITFWDHNTADLKTLTKMIEYAESKDNHTMGSSMWKTTTSEAVHRLKQQKNKLQTFDKLRKKLEAKRLTK